METLLPAIIESKGCEVGYDAPKRSVKQIACMETPAEREARIRRLEQGRAQRRGQAPLSAEPVSEIAPGRGNLNVSSTPYYGPGSPILTHSLSLLGYTVSYARLFQTQPWIAAAVMRMLTWAVRVPLKMYRRTGDDSRVRLRSEDHPLAKAIVSPWERGSPASLTMDLLGPMLVHGNSITEVLEGASGKIEFAPKDWRYAAPLMPWRDSLEGFKFDTDVPELAREQSIDQILHCAWAFTGVTGPIGVSPLMQLGVTLRIEDAAQRYQQGLFRNGARPPSAVTASEEFLGLERTERQQIMAQLRKDLTELYTTPENAGRPALLPPGLDWKPVGHTAEEAALVDQRKVAREEVSAVYMIPPPMLGILDKATYSNIETQHEMIYTDCLGPPLVLIEQTIIAQLIQALLREDDVYVEYDFSAVLRGDPLKAIENLRSAIGSALLTPNEGRTILNYQRSTDDAMDQFYLPFNNLAPINAPPPRIPSNAPPASDNRDGHRVFVTDRGRVEEVAVP